MQNPLNPIVNTIFGESRLEDVSLDALHLLTVKYPFSAPAHMLYARRLKDLGDSRYAEAVSIAALHYVNPHWLQHQLSAPLDVEGYATDTPSDSTALLEETEAENREMEALPPNDGDHGHDMDDAATDTVTGESDAYSETIPVEADVPGSDILSETFAPEPASDEEEAATATEFSGGAGTEAMDSPAESLLETDGPEPASDAETVIELDGVTAPADSAAEAPELPSELPSHPTPYETPSAAEQVFNLDEPPVSREEIVGTGQASDIRSTDATETGITTLYEGETTEAAREVGDSELIHVTMPDTGSADLQEAPADGDLPEAVGVSPDLDSPTDGGHPQQPETVESAPVSLESTGGRREKEIPMSEELPLPVEPLHLTDYLASQGIVVSSELEPREDGRGERSFTGWLRTMKRFQPDRSAPVLSEEDEDVIRSEAEVSNQDEDVVTEAMAEVYARQGLIPKAIDIYSKLCLLDPDRTSTFADRITQLKALLT